ncbi:CU044_2847 family protein [Streptomyces sp. NPDC002550]
MLSAAAHVPDQTRLAQHAQVVDAALTGWRVRLSHSTKCRNPVRASDWALRRSKEIDVSTCPPGGLPKARLVTVHANDVGGALPYVARLPLESGGWVLVEAPATAPGPVKAGRVGDAIHDLPGSLQGALAPVTEAARATLEQLRRAGPDEIRVEFGVDLAVEAGAVITKTGANCHLKVTMTWKRDERSHPGPDESSR